MATKMGKYKIFCPKCNGNGFYRVPYHLAREEAHAQCDDCDRTGELWVEDKLDHKKEYHVEYTNKKGNFISTIIKGKENK